METYRTIGYFYFHLLGDHYLTKTNGRVHKAAMQPLPPSPPPRSKIRQRRDRLWQLLYQAAYLLCRCFWFMFRPMGKGTLVAVWHGGRLLLIRNGYRRGYSLPGGGRHAGESARKAAVRELREEVGLHIYPNQLRYRGTVISTREHLRDHCAYFDVDLKQRPRIDVDAREVVDAVFVAPGDWDTYPLARQVRTYLRRYYEGS